MIPSTLIRVFAPFLSHHSAFDTLLLSRCFPRCFRHKELLFFIIVCYVFLTLFWFHHVSVHVSAQTHLALHVSHDGNHPFRLLYQSSNTASHLATCSI
ncbi:hypothetical protein ARMGADRAFT_745012 [Armillaria gallica]|uniref:Uncharacterized protein n=1 Tax=Armillaria gallica TaxID=47427 RepID=A0A2H3E7U4_ARMGA|nr:hypothetical protein ARMGADRAFT_745012 [Armillaria gallica]